jgi:hypothetical protein
MGSKQVVIHCTPSLVIQSALLKSIHLQPGAGMWWIGNNFHLIHTEILKATLMLPLHQDKLSLVVSQIIKSATHIWSHPITERKARWNRWQLPIQATIYCKWQLVSNKQGLCPFVKYHRSSISLRQVPIQLTLNRMIDKIIGLNFWLSVRISLQRLCKMNRKLLLVKMPWAVHRILLSSNQLLPQYLLMTLSQQVALSFLIVWI